MESLKDALLYERIYTVTRQIPAGQVVIVATQSLEATTFFNRDTLASLQSLGLTTEALTPPFAAIGVKGAAAGSALQAVGDAQGRAYLRVGFSPDTRNLAAAVDEAVIARP